MKTKNVYRGNYIGKCNMKYFIIVTILHVLGESCGLPTEGVHDATAAAIQNISKLNSHSARNQIAAGKRTTKVLRNYRGRSVRSTQNNYNKTTKGDSGDIQIRAEVKKTGLTAINTIHKEIETCTGATTGSTSVNLRRQRKPDRNYVEQDGPDGRPQNPDDRKLHREVPTSRLTRRGDTTKKMSTLMRTRMQGRTLPPWVSFNESCDYLAYQCLKAYDTGSICARTVYLSEFYTFSNYCMMDYINCLQKREVWYIAYMGHCITHILPATQYEQLPYEDDYFLDQTYIIEPM